jgi:hypothetical protein|tara:strand:+ start:787 stop:1776 length:990 start_codon:yes stop_codon:yes gene_type:complete
MKITIDSTAEIKESFLVDLSGNRLYFKTDEQFVAREGWYELNLPFTGEKTNITDIKINDESILHTIYTAYYTTGIDRHQPATGMWNDGGVLKLWLHTNIGIFFERVFSDIDSGDFGADLNEKYVFTVDRPLTLQKKFPRSIKDFFAHGDGPHWWKLGTDFTPYRILDTSPPPQETIIEELHKICIYDKKAFDGVMDLKTICKNKADLPFKHVDWENAPHLRKLLLEQIGYNNIIDISMQTLAPNSCIALHRDDHYKREKYPLIRGCKKMYWPLGGDWSKNYFKLGKSGVVPFNNKPHLINTIEHVHTAVNESDNPRIVLIVYGDLSDDK